MSREQLAAEHGMSMDYVNWFFDHKKDGCGNVWFMMMAAMWEGWQAAPKASEQQLSESRREFTAANATIHNLELKVEQVVAENAALKNPDNWLSLSDYGYEGSEVATGNGASEDEALRAGMTAIINRITTPATEAYLAEVRAQGVELFALEWGGHDSPYGQDAYNFAAQLRQGAEQ